MHIVISVYPKRVAALSPLWGDFTLFIPRGRGIRRDHVELVRHAIAQRWDESVQIQQDDILVEYWPSHQGEITSYYAGRNGHVCPWAFTATPKGWKRLLGWWSSGQLCNSWQPDHLYDEARQTWP